MIEDFSESKYNISCDQCGHEISDELIKKNQDQNKPLYCELCGAQINLKSSEKEEVSKRKGKGEIITQHEEKEVRFSYTTKELRQEIINYVYQKTYELLKTTPFVIRRLKQQKDLKHFQKIKLAKKLRRILLYTSLPTHGLEQLTKISQKKIKNYFDNFKSGLKTKQKFQPKIHPRIIENIEFIYRLINGDFELSTLSKDNQKAVKKLLHTQGFKINIKTKNSFSYQLSLFLCRQIYKKITTQGHVLELLPNKNQLTEHYILNTAKDMVALILNDLLKRRFSRHYRTLKRNLELDWVYRESLINHICSLVKFVYKLTYSIRNKSKLNGFERLIADDLKRSKFFENDECLTPEFKLNITLILCRIIYKIIESNKNFTSQSQKSNILNKKKMLNVILEEILVGNEIKSEFLKKVYKLSVEEFQKEYDNFLAKMKIDIIYKENFRIYLFQLIKIIIRITQRRSKKSKHTKIELVIINDLSNYNFIWDNNQIDSRDCFIIKEKKTLDLDKNNQIINLPVSRSFKNKSFTKSKPIWNFIYEYIKDNSEKLLLLKEKYNTDDRFFTFLSELLIDKLSNETRLLMCLHSNTKKALPKVIIAIFLLYFQDINSITGDELEKKTGMVGQYEKLRAIADHLDLELPFIMGDVVEKILEEKRKDIFRGDFFPSQENIYRLDKRLTPSRKMVKTISRWIRKNSDYQNLTELRHIVYEKKEKTSKEEVDKFVLLNSNKIKHSKEIRKICDKIIQRDPDINSYADIKRAIGVVVTDYFRTDHRRYIKLSKFLRLQELYGNPIPHKKFVKRFTTDKWIFLWQDSEGNPITKEHAIDLASKYLIKEVLKYNTNNYDLDYIINLLGRNDFISALSERGIRYNEVLVKLDLELHSDAGKWEGLDWSLDGYPRTYDKALANAAKYLSKLLADYDYNIVKIPSQEYIVKNHEDFHAALRRYNLNFYDVLKETGFPNDKFRKKWWNFDYDEQGNPLIPKEQEKIIFQFFKENIIPIYMDKGLIEGNLGPSYDEALNVLKNTKFHGFISAMNARGITHGNLLVSLGLSPRITQNQRVGTAFHWIAENIFMKHTRIDNNCVAFYESKINEENFVRPDNTILVNEDFRKLSKCSRQIPLKIKYIHIDYYLIHLGRRSQYKFDRGYQSNDSILILVPLNIKKSKNTQHRNIKILSVYDFCDFFGFSDERRRKFIHFARLALGSVRETKDSMEKLSKLEQKADQYENELTTNPKINFSIKKNN